MVEGGQKEEQGKGEGREEEEEGRGGGGYPPRRGTLTHPCPPLPLPLLPPSGTPLRAPHANSAFWKNMMDRLRAFKDRLRAFSLITLQVSRLISWRRRRAPHPH